MTELHIELSRQTARRQLIAADEALQSSKKSSAQNTSNSSGCISNNSIDIYINNTKSNSTQKNRNIRNSIKKRGNKNLSKGFSYDDNDSNKSNQRQHQQKKKDHHHQKDERRYKHHQQQQDKAHNISKMDRRARYNKQKVMKTSEVQAFLVSSDDTNKMKPRGSRDGKDSFHASTSTTYKNLTPRTWKRTIRSSFNAGGSIGNYEQNGERGKERQTIWFGSYLHGVDGIGEHVHINKGRNAVSEGSKYGQKSKRYGARCA